MGRSSYFLHTCSEKRNRLRRFKTASRYLTEVVSHPPGHSTDERGHREDRRQVGELDPSGEALGRQFRGKSHRSWEVCGHIRSR